LWREISVRPERTSVAFSVVSSSMPALRHDAPSAGRHEASATSAMVGVTSMERKAANGRPAATAGSKAMSSTTRSRAMVVGTSVAPPPPVKARRNVRVAGSKSTAASSTTGRPLSSIAPIMNDEP
jgi:hypothetical protein